MDLLKSNWLKILAIASVQCIVGYLVFIFYLFFTWIFFGEGGNSVLYTLANRIIWALSPIVGATMLNGYRIFRGVKAADKGKIQTYIAIQILLTIAYIIFTVIQLSHNEYRI